MPLPLLARLADRGLADLDGVPDGIVRLDPRVSGVGSVDAAAAGPQPVRRGGAPVGDGRGRASSGTRCRCRRSCSPPPRTTRGFVPDVVRPRQRRARRLRRRRPGPPAGAGLGAAGVPRRRGGGPALPRRAGAGRASRSAAAAAGATSTTRSTTSCGRCSPSAGRSSSCTPAASRPEAAGRLLHAAARRLPRRDRDRGRPAGVQRRAGAVPDPRCAWPTAAAACRPCAGGWTWAGSARRWPAPRRCRRARTPTGSTTTPRCSTRRCCAGWWRTWGPTTC